MKGPDPPERPNTRPRWPQDASNLVQVELGLPKISTSWAKMAKVSDMMTQDGGKIPKMKDVSSISGTSGGEGYHQVSNSAAGRGAGEVPPLGP